MMVIPSSRAKAASSRTAGTVSNVMITEYNRYITDNSPIATVLKPIVIVHCTVCLS